MSAILDSSHHFRGHYAALRAKEKSAMLPDTKPDSWPDFLLSFGRTLLASIMTYVHENSEELVLPSYRCSAKKAKYSIFCSAQPNDASSFLIR